MLYWGFGSEGCEFSWAQFFPELMRQGDVTIYGLSHLYVQIMRLKRCHIYVQSLNKYSYGYSSRLTIQKLIFGALPWKDIASFRLFEFRLPNKMPELFQE